MKIWLLDRLASLVCLSGRTGIGLSWKPKMNWQSGTKADLRLEWEQRMLRVAAQKLVVYTRHPKPPLQHVRTDEMFFASVTV